MKQKTVLIIFGLIVIAAIGLRLKTFFVQEQATAIVKDQTLKVEIMADERSRARGLSGRFELAPEAGMVFLFDKPDFHNFWMKDMFFPIDIIWINNGQIVDIIENVPAPAFGEVKLPPYSPQEAITIVLEVNAGWSKKHNIQIGDSFLLKY